MSTYDALTNTPEKMRLYQQERAIESVTALICRLMSANDITRADLARKLDKTPGWITQLLDGEKNKTVRTLSDVFTALGHKIEFYSEPIIAQTQPVLSYISLTSMATAGVPNADDTLGSGISTVPSAPPCIAA